MKNLELEVKDNYNNKQNLILKLDGREVGFLYVDEEEKYELLKIIRRGIDDDTNFIEPAETENFDEDEAEY
jgi:hypothetical protein